MRNYYKTNLEALDAEIKNKTAYFQKMREHVKEIKKAMDVLTKEKYSGPSADAFRAGMSKMTGQVLVNQIDLVDSTVQTLKTLYTDYADLKKKDNQLGEIFGVSSSMASSGNVSCDIIRVDEMKVNIRQIVEAEYTILDTLDEVEDTLYGSGCDDSVFMAIEDAKASVRNLDKFETYSMALTSYAGNVVDLDDKAKMQITALIPLKAHNYPSAPVHRTHRKMLRNKISTLNAVTADDIDMSQFEAYLRRCGKYTEDEIQEILEVTRKYFGARLKSTTAMIAKVPTSEIDKIWCEFAKSVCAQLVPAKNIDALESYLIGNGQYSAEEIQQILEYAANNCPQELDNTIRMLDRVPGSEKAYIWNGFVNKVNTSIMTNNLAEYALTQIGEREINGTNNVKYNTWYYEKEVCDPAGEAYAWCAVFVLYCANEVGMLGTNNLPSHSEASLSTFERVVNMREHYINQGNFYSRDSGYHPATGDIIFFKYPDGGNHTGIVIAYDEESETVYTVEGNAGDAVRNRSYNITHGDIVGYGSNGGMNNQSLISKVDGTAYEGDLGTR